MVEKYEIMQRHRRQTTKPATERNNDNSVCRSCGGRIVFSNENKTIVDGFCPECKKAEHFRAKNR